MRILQAIICFFLLSSVSFAAITVKAPQPTACVLAQFSSQNDKDGDQTITLTMTNKCGTPVDFQNVAVTFLDLDNINRVFTVKPGPLSAPDNKLKITARRQTDKLFLASFTLHFPGNSILPDSTSIQIQFDGLIKDIITSSPLVYLSSPILTGNIQLINSSANPSGVSQAFAVVHVTGPQGPLSIVHVPWSSQQTLQGLTPGNYAVSAENVVDSTGNTYQATVSPASFPVVANQTASSTITYNKVQPTGKVSITLQTLPSQLTGYTHNPTVLVMQNGTGSSTPVTIAWGTTSTVSQLVAGSTYSFSTPGISFNNYICQPQFLPATLVANATTVPVTNLTYSCTPVAQSKVTINVSGGPTTLSSLNVTFTPNNSSQPVVQAVSLTNGSGSASTLLTTGTLYQVSTDAVAGYAVNFNPEPLTATNNAVETISLTPSGPQGIKKVVLILLENENKNSVISQGPYEKSLTQTGAWLSQSFAITHPSQPNYIALIAGQLFGVSGDGNVNINGKHLGNLLEAKGHSWKMYAEDYPGNCFLGATSGKYARKHVPFISFINVQSNPAECAKVVPGTQFFTDLAANNLPDFSFYSPNLSNDGHDTGVAFADAWLKKTFGPILSNPQLMQNMLIIVTYDEGSTSGNNNIYTTFNGPSVKPGFVSNVKYTHYSLLNAIETIFNTGNLGANDATATPITDIWQP